MSCSNDSGVYLIYLCQCLLLQILEDIEKEEELELLELNTEDPTQNVMESKDGCSLFVTQGDQDGETQTDCTKIEEKRTQHAEGNSVRSTETDNNSNSMDQQEENGGEKDQKNQLTLKPGRYFDLHEGLC